MNVTFRVLANKLLFSDAGRRFDFVLMTNCCHCSRHILLDLPRFTSTTDDELLLLHLSHLFISLPYLQYLRPIQYLFQFIHNNPI